MNDWILVVDDDTSNLKMANRNTKGHSIRVAEYSREIARRIGLSEKAQDDIYMIGLLHDVGKIGVPDAIINKPAKLTDEEYAIIKQHPSMGAEILKNITEFPKLGTGARWHHERYDGKGYPDGISSEEIPMEARIIAIADAYDAMSSRRSYRDVLPQDQVRGEVEKGKGTQFDPVYAEIMLAMIDEDTDYQMRESRGNVMYEQEERDTSIEFKLGESDLEYVQSKGTLAVGITDFAPMDYRDGEDWTGFDANLARAFAERIGVTLEFVEIDWDQKTELLEKGSIDCIWNGMTMTEELQEAISCSEPYLSNAQVVVLQSSEMGKYSTAESCQHLLFAVEAGSTGESLLKDMKYRYTTFPTQMEALQSVSEKKADATRMQFLVTRL